MLLVSFSLRKDTVCFIQWLPGAGESGWRYVLQGGCGSAFPATSHLSLFHWGRRPDESRSIETESSHRGRKRDGGWGGPPSGGLKKQERIQAFEVLSQQRGRGVSGGGGDSKVKVLCSHLVPVAVLRNHVHQQDVFGTGDESRQADLAVREHPPGKQANVSARTRRRPPTPPPLGPPLAAALPARFGDDHLGSDVVEGLPELRLLQGQPDVALQICVRGHGGGSGAAEARLQVCRGRKALEIASPRGRKEKREKKAHL